jgi:hypothetical protein
MRYVGAAKIDMMPKGHTGLNPMAGSATPGTRSYSGARSDGHDSLSFTNAHFDKNEKIFEGLY